MKYGILTLSGALALSLVSGCLDTGGSSSADEQPTQALRSNEGQNYQAQVRRTAFGIPHIRANDFGSMGYAYGYVQAQDNLCLLAEDTLTIRGLRARYLGGDGEYIIPANGVTTTNTNADFFWRSVMTEQRIDNFRDSSDPEVVDASLGFVEGYNRYLNEIREGEHPGRHAECRDEKWLLELEEEDMYRRYFRLGVLASSSVFAEGIANAAPPLENQAGVEPAETLENLQAQQDELPFPLGGELPIGSNMYGLGPEATRNGQSMLFGNPHFPWEKTERLYMAHLQVGNEANIMGAALYGLPAVLIGFNEDFAWSHTVSTAFRFSFYELTLDPADPTRYLYEGEFRDMEREEITIAAKNADGEIEEKTRTLYHSHYGPMLEFEVSGVPVLSWSSAKAYTLRDANAENDRMVNQFFRWNKADSLEEFVQLHSEVLGVPWVNTVATGPGQPAYYGDITVVPHVTDAKAQQCQTALSPVFDELAPGLPLLDGSREDCEWGSDEDAPAEGIFGPSNLPTLTRNDWVHNCNDSYWLSNPKEPLTGFDAIIGDEETARTLRTRICMTNVIDRLNDSDGLEGGPGFDLENLQRITLDNALKSERLARQDVINAYCDLPLMVGTDGVVETQAACDALRNWDGTNNLDSRGGHVWREFWRRIDPLPAESPVKWLEPFDANDPVRTPASLNVGDPAIQAAFADAISAVEDAGVAMDAPMGDIQFSRIHDGERLPVFGGESFEGSFAIANTRNPSGLTEEGYSVNYGNSYIQAVTWDEQGNPVAEGFVTYSQSTDPASPHYRDMTEAYRDKQWIRFPFTEREINTDPNLERFRLRGEREQ